MSDLLLGGVFRWEHRSASGKLRGRGRFHNGVCAAALDDLLESAFRQGTQRIWYGGLIDRANFTALSAADTMASHAGWQELTTYSGARLPWAPGAASAGVVINPGLMLFTFTADQTAHGLFLASDATKGGTSGVLWATGEFEADREMSTGEVLAVDYELTAAAGEGS